MTFENEWRKNEYEYMSILENSTRFPETDLEYAADLPSHKYGSAFPVNADPKFPSDQSHLSPLNLMNVNKQKNSLF